MAVTAFKTFIAGEVLTAADLNSSFAKVFDNGESLGWPATTSKDLNGNELILDADKDTSLTSDTDDQVDVRIGGTDKVILTSTNAKFEDTLLIKERAAAIADEASYGQIWVDDAAPNELFFTNDAGTDFLCNVGQATQSAIESETNENTYAPPDLIKYSPGVANMWVRYDASSGTPTINESYNVTSLTDNGVGLTTINFTNNFTSTTKIAAFVAHSELGQGSQAAMPKTFTASTVAIETAIENPADTTQYRDPPVVCAMAIGILA